MVKLFIAIATVLALGIGTATNVNASEPPQLLSLELHPVSPITWPNSSAVLLTLMELEDDSLNRDAIGLRWQMEGNDLGDVLTLNPFGATLVTGDSQNEREITVTAFYNEEIYSSATIEVIPALEAKNISIGQGLSTPGIATEGEPSYGQTMKTFYLRNVPDETYQIALLSSTDTLFLEDSESTFVPKLGATLTTGTVELTDGWGTVIVGYDTAGVHERTNNTPMLFVWKGEYGHEDFFVFSCTLHVIFVEPYFRPMHLALPVWNGPRTNSGLSDWSGIPPSYRDFASVVTFLPMMISGPFVDTEVYWEIEGMVDGDWFDERRWFSEWAGHYASSGRLHLGESLEEREITVSITWVDNEDYYDSETIFINPNGVNIVPLQQNVLVPGEDFIEIPVKTWGIEDGVYHGRVYLSRSSPLGLTAFYENNITTSGRDGWRSVFNGEVKVVDGITTFLLGIDNYWDREWFIHHFKWGYLIEFAIIDPQFLDINNWGTISTMIPIQIMPKMPE